MYDYWNGLRRDDRDARSFTFDPRPVVAGELGAGTFGDGPGPCSCPAELAPYCMTDRPCAAA